MEANYSKDEILELYLNTIYFGSNYYGIREASLGYFGKEPDKLALPEAAMLAGLPNAPSLYSPYVDFLMAKKRQFVVLEAMVRTGAGMASARKSVSMWEKHVLGGQTFDVIAKRHGISRQAVQCRVEKVNAATLKWAEKVKREAA